jgi:hypothetical protein
MWDIVTGVKRPDLEAGYKYLSTDEIKDTSIYISSPQKQTF